MTTSTFDARLAVAIAMTAATSTRCMVERPDICDCIEPDVSITTSVPSTAGMFATVLLERSAERPLPVVRRRVLVRRPHLVREQAGLGHLVGVGDLGDDRLDCLLRDVGELFERCFDQNEP